MSYLITPPEEPTWRIEEAIFLRELRQRWPHAHVEAITDQARLYSCTWVILVGDRALEGGLARDGRFITVDGQIRDCAEFAAWFRSQVPADRPLVFCDDAYNHDIELRAGTDVADILGALCGRSIITPTGE